MENPATWTEVERTIDETLRLIDENHAKPPDQMRIGFSRAKQISNALRVKGLLPTSVGERDQKLDVMMAEIEALGYGSPEYHEAMWMLLSVMARRQAIIAESLKTSQRSAELRAQRKAER